MNRRLVLALIVLLALVASVAFLLWKNGRAQPAGTAVGADAAAHPPRSTGVSASANAPVAARAATVPPALAAELSRLLAIAEPGERFRRLDEFWRRWFARDREAVFGALAGLPPGDERAQALLFALTELAATDPDRALGLALALVRDAQDAHLFASLFDTFARQDLALARERLARVAGVGFEPAWRAYADAYARADLGAALRWAKALPDGAGRALALETALFSLAEQDPGAAFETALHELTGEARDRSLYQALTQIIPHDPAGAAALIVQMPASPSRDLAVAAAARAWADDAPERALAWAAALPADASAAAATAVANILEIWAQRDAGAAQAALAALPEGEARAAAAERMAAVLALASPAQALDWALTLPDGATQDRAFTAALALWARQDPAQAAAWTLASGAGDERGALLANVVSHWATQDLAAAQRYVATLTDAAAQTRAATALMPYLVRSDPRAALTWAAANLSDPTVRLAAQRAAYREWLASDPVAARAWAASDAAPSGW